MNNNRFSIFCVLNQTAMAQLLEKWKEMKKNKSFFTKKTLNSQAYKIIISDS